MDLDPRNMGTNRPIAMGIVAGAGATLQALLDKAEDLVPAFERAKNHELPAVVCVKTDLASNLIPPFADKFVEVYEGPPQPEEAQAYPVPND